VPGLGPYTIDIKNPTREFVLQKTGAPVDLVVKIIVGDR
jgi:hypothetical protein